MEILRITYKTDIRKIINIKQLGEGQGNLRNKRQGKERTEKDMKKGIMEREMYSIELNRQSSDL